jgi:ABC-2 type transport system permease protein
MKNLFYGTPKLMRFILRKERVSTFVWLGVLTGLTLFVAIMYGGMYAEADSRSNMSDLWNLPAIVAMLGPIFGEATLASLYASSMILTMVITVAIMNIFFVIRHTRAEEEKSLGEVVRSLPVGRLANLTATMLFALLVNIAIAVLTTVSLWGIYGFAGSAVYGFAIGMSGFAFAGIAAVFANLSSSKGGAIGMSIGVVLFFYMLRAIGDVSVIALSFISPIGLAAQSQPMAGNVVWPLFVLLAIGVALSALALYLNSIRDFGRGLLSARKGRGEGGMLMKSPEGVLFRLTRRSMLFWAAGLFSLGASYGVVMGETESFLDMIPGIDDVRAFITMITMMTALVSVVPALIAVLRLAGEEKNGRYENVFAGSVSRSRMMTAHLVSALLQSFIMMFAACFGLWLCSYAVMDDPIAFSEMFGAFMVYLPAAWVMIGLAALLVGLIPRRATLIAFSYFGLSFVLLYFGTLAGYPEAAYITPFGFVPQIPLDTVNPWIMISLVAVSALLIVSAYFAYNRRDLKLGV